MKKQRPPKSDIHLRRRTENVVGGTQLISACGVRELASTINNRHITTNADVVTCLACLVGLRLKENQRNKTW